MKTIISNKKGLFSDPRYNGLVIEGPVTFDGVPTFNGAQDTGNFRVITYSDLGGGASARRLGPSGLPHFVQLDFFGRRLPEAVSCFWCP